MFLAYYMIILAGSHILINAVFTYGIDSVECATHNNKMASLSLSGAEGDEEKDDDEEDNEEKKGNS